MSSNCTESSADILDEFLECVGNLVPRISFPLPFLPNRIVLSLSLSRDKTNHLVPRCCNVSIAKILLQNRIEYHLDFERSNGRKIKNFRDPPLLLLSFHSNSFHLVCVSISEWFFKITKSKLPNSLLDIYSREYSRLDEKERTCFRTNLSRNVSFNNLFHKFFTWKWNKNNFLPAFWRDTVVKMWERMNGLNESSEWKKIGGGRRRTRPTWRSSPPVPIINRVLHGGEGASSRERTKGARAVGP